jgi:Lipocalin-like domain
MQRLRLLLLAVALALCAFPALAQDSLKSKLLGAWRLISYIAEAASGEAVYPLGPAATGYIIYTADGHMSATVMRPERPGFASPDPMAGTADEHAAASAGYLSYAGTFEVDEASGIVVHHIKTALVPNWVGSDFKRKVMLDGDKLELRGLAPALIGGEMRLVRVLWQRANAN